MRVAGSSGNCGTKRAGGRKKGKLFTRLFKHGTRTQMNLLSRSTTREHTRVPWVLALAGTARLRMLGTRRVGRNSAVCCLGVWQLVLIQISLRSRMLSPLRSTAFTYTTSSTTTKRTSVRGTGISFSSLDGDCQYVCHCRCPVGCLRSVYVDRLDDDVIPNWISNQETAWKQN